MNTHGTQLGVCLVAKIARLMSGTLSASIGHSGWPGPLGWPVRSTVIVVIATDEPDVFHLGACLEGAWCPLGRHRFHDDSGVIIQKDVSVSVSDDLLARPVLLDGTPGGHP